MTVDFKTTDFTPGQRVVYKGRAQTARGVPFTGQTATVIRPIKSRKVVHIRWEQPSIADTTFEAAPQNLTPLPD